MNELTQRWCVPSDLLAIASIPAGSEITVSYLSRPMPYELRQKNLQQYALFQFTCTCSTCTLSFPYRRQNDERINRLLTFLQALEQGRQLPPPLSLMRQLASLAMTAAEDSGMTPMLGLLVGLATQTCISGADETNARAWADLFVEWSWFVKDMPSLQQAVACLQPRQHPVWGRELQRTGGKRETLQAPVSRTPLSLS